MPDLDIDRLRADTAGCEQSIFFNNAGASLQPRPVVARVTEHLRLEERIGGYEASDAVADELAGVYASLARLLNCAPEEVALQESATRAWDSAFYSFQFAPGDRILTAASEYASNYIAFLHVGERTGVEICVVDSDASGQLDIEAMRRLLDDRVKLIALTHMPTNGGLVQPAAEVGRIAREANVPFLLDACQSAGQINLDVEALGCDMLSATGRKFLRGPRGTGFLYVRTSLLPRLRPAVLDMRAADWVATNKFELRPDAKRFESWESSAALRLGMGAAVEYALALGLSNIERRVQSLAALLRRRLGEINGVTVHDQGRVLSGIVTFTLEPHSAQAVMGHLKRNHISVRITDRFAARLDLERRGLNELVRASVHYYNTEEEVDRFCKILTAL
jgi:cysteine desulfurase / selenocysteine lyase